MLKTYSRLTKPRDLPGELPVEFESACRLCLEKDDAMVNIFGDRDIIPIALKIRTCITIDVSDEDKLPKMVCQRCLNQLDSFYTFKKRCLATNVKLKQYVALPPSQTNTRETRDINEYLDLTLSEDGNEEDIKNACTITWEEKQGTHAPIFEFPVALMNREEDLPAKSQPDKKTEPIYAQENVDSAGYISEDSMEDFAGFEEQSEYEAELKKRLKLLNIETNPEGTPFVIARGRGRPKKIRNPLQCDVCYIIYKSEQEVKEHMVSHVSKVKSCAICQKSFNNRSMLQRHLRVHTGERPFPCDVCGKAFSQKEILLRHKVVHSGERPYVCDICERAYSLPEALKTHLRLQHSNTSADTRYHCCKCNKVFCHASGLSRHQLRHSGVMFSCTFCKKVFTDASSVKRHLRSHPKGKKANASLQYEIIKLELGEHSYSLLSKSDTEESINTVPEGSLTSSDSKSSICTFCSKEFNSEDELKTHCQSMHKENRYKYKCDHCDKQFRFPTGLSRHQLTHSVNNLKERNIKVEIKTNKIKKCFETSGVKRGGLRVRSFEAIGIRKKKTKNVGIMDESIEEVAIRKEESKNNQDLPRGINDNQELSINGEIVDHSEEISSKEDEIYYEEKMDDSEVICDTQEEPKNGEMLDESAEISIVPDKSIIEETVLSSEGIGIMSKKFKNEVTMDNSVEISIILKESNGEIVVDSEEISAMPEDSINGEIGIVPQGSVSGESLVGCEEINVISEESKNEKRINDSEQIHIMPNESIKEEMSVDFEEINIKSEYSKDGKMMDDSDEMSILADESISEEIDVDSEEISVISEESKDGKTIDDSEGISILPDQSINEEMSVDSKEIGVMSEDSTNEKMVYDSKVTEKSINEVIVDSEGINFRIKNSNTVDIILDSEEICAMSEDSKNRIMIDDCGEINIILENSINEKTGVDSEEIGIIPKDTKNVEIVGDLFDKNSVMCHESNSKEKMNDLSGKNNVTQKESKNAETENDPRKEITVKRRQTAEEIEKEIFG